MVSRKTLALDSALVDGLKAAARRRGLTLSNYLRSLIKEALMLEELGLYAPRALREKRIEHILEDLGFIFVPREALLPEKQSELAEEVGRRVGYVSKELGVEPAELVEFLSKYAGNVVMDSRRLIVLKDPERADFMVELLRGIAESAGLKVSSNESMVVIETPFQTLQSSLNAFKGRRRGRAP